jgi:hypothetical protein
MSEWFGSVQDLGKALGGSIDSALTVLGIILTIAVFSLVFPYIVEIVGTTTGMAKSGTV